MVAAVFVSDHVAIFLMVAAVFVRDHVAIFLMVSAVFVRDHTAIFLMVSAVFFSINSKNNNYSSFKNRANDGEFNCLNLLLSIV